MVRRKPSGRIAKTSVGGITLKDIDLVKIGFHLEVEEDWPPYPIEHLWAQPAGEAYIIKNFPFFVKGIAFGDVISGDLDEDGYISSWKLIKPSGHSTIWIHAPPDSDIISRVEQIGCGVEAGALPDLYTVNAPPEVDYDELESILDSYSADDGVSIAYPAYRR